ncbi:MAG TPA: hypothetical protein VLE91_00395 [Candidatus Saccharimonadales bacterium]|nr:hypothetical protein [Candidatus Saccharimonadales bacterium]
MANHEMAPQIHAGINIVNELPVEWRSELLRGIRKAAVLHITYLNDITSREDDFTGREFPTVVATGSALVEEVPWLEEFCRQHLAERASYLFREEIVVVDGLDGIITGNVFGPDMRMESHRDSWHDGGNVYIKEPWNKKGGLLVVAANPDARTYNQIVENPEFTVYPTEGTFSLVALAGRAHTVTPVGRSSFGGEARMRYVLRSGVFKIPDIKSEEFWDKSRVSLNINFMVKGQTIEEASDYGNTAGYVHGKK